jgi:cysteine-rich repeat protein
MLFRRLVLALCLLGLAGTAGAVCGDGVLDPGEQCDDGNAAGGCCTATCTLAPLATPCDDHDACTTASVCNALGVCVGTQPAHCDDGDKCTVDHCDPADGCHNDRVDFAITRTEVEMPLAVDACAGEKIPASVARPFTKARKFLARADKAHAAKKRRALVAKAAAQLKAANGAEQKLDGQVSLDCDTLLQTRVRTGRSRVGCLLKTL